MKIAVAFSFLLACGGVLLADSPGGIPSRDSRSLLQDLVRMTNAGLSNETILVYAKAHRLELPSEVSSDDLRWLRQSGVGVPVIRYMAAIDVRSEDGGAGRDADDGDAYDSDEAVRYSARLDSYSDGGYDDNRYAGGSYDNYADNSYDNSYDSYPETYYNDYYPVYGAGFYPYPAYFFADFGGFYGRFGGRGFGRGFEGRRGRGFDRGGFGRQRFSSGDFDRSRGTRGGFDRGFGTRRGAVTLGRDGPGRPTFVAPRRFDQGFRGSRGDVVSRGVPAQRSFSRGGFAPGPRAPRGPVARSGGFGRPGFSGGGHSGGFGRPSFSGGGRSGGSVSRGPVARSGGSRGAPGGRGRR